MPNRWATVDLRPLTIQLHEDTLAQLKRLADGAHETVEAYVTGLVYQAIADHRDFQTWLEELEAGLSVMSDEHLLRAARSRLPKRDARRLSDLNAEAKWGPLSEAELAEQRRLGRHYDTVVLVRAKAALILKQHGYDTSELGPPIYGISAKE